MMELYYGKINCGLYAWTSSILGCHCIEVDYEISEGILRKGLFWQRLLIINAASDHQFNTGISTSQTNTTCTRSSSM